MQWKLILCINSPDWSKLEWTTLSVMCFVFPLENHESLHVLLSEETVSDLENKPKFLESEELDSLPKRQFKMAEIADAVMGTETPFDRSDIESLFPKESGFSPPCDENSDQCVSPVQDEDLALLQEEESETMQQVH